MKNDNLTATEEKAAVLIQSNYRGYLSRKSYVLNSHSPEKEDNMSVGVVARPTSQSDGREMSHLQSVQLISQPDDDNTTRSNKYRHYTSQVILIQRVWRRHRRGLELSADRAEKMSIADVETSKSDDEESVDSINGNSPVSEFTGNFSQHSMRGDEVDLDQGTVCGKDEDSVSILSDISEITESLREHFVANVKIIHKEDLDAGNTMYPETETEITRNAHESEADYQKRVKKINYLSLAQEFAELKKHNESAQSMDRRKQVDTDEEETATPCIEEKAFVSEEFGGLAYQSRRDASPYRGVRSESMPSLSLANKMNWSLFDRQIEAAEEVKKSRRNDREEIRRKLAMGADEDYYGGERAFKKPNLQTRLQSGMNLQLCFMNEAPSDTEMNDVETLSELSPSLSRIQQYNERVAPMQFCFINDIPSDDESESETERTDTDYIVTTSSAPQSNVLANGHVNYETDGAKSSSEDTTDLIRDSVIDQSETETVSRDSMSPCDWTSAASVRPADSDRESTPVATSVECECGCAVDDDDKVTEGPNTRHRDIMKYFDTPKQLMPPLRKKPLCRHNTRPVSEADIDLYQLRKLQLEQGEDFYTKQARLQAEAKMALAQVRPMAHMQLEIERQNRKKSPIAEIVGVPGIGGRRSKRATKQVLMFDMNIAQLQVLVNDLHSQIEALNEELVSLLVERDDLHMEQDSMLVDIEDLTRRAQECASKLNLESKLNPVKQSAPPISMGRKLLTSVRKK